MAYDALNNLIDAYIYRNGIQAITGQILNGVLKQMVAQLGGGYNLMGVAIPDTTPATNDEPLAYFAATAGEYTDFGGITLAAGEIAVLQTSGDGTWAKQTIYNVPTGTADLENTANFITNAVTDLVNYYTKTEIDALPNGEDIDFDEDGKLQFANRVYNAQQPNGMGYKILRKDATFASQVTATNTIYEIRYNYTLSANFTVPSGCVLKFVGGSIDGAFTLNLNDCQILGTNEWIGTSLSIAGKTASPCFADWFKGSDSDKIEKAISFFSVVGLNAREYNITRTINVLHSCRVYGFGMPDFFGDYSSVGSDLSQTYLVTTMESGTMFNIRGKVQSNNISAFGSFVFEGIGFNGNAKKCDALTFTAYAGPSRPVVIQKCTFKQCNKGISFDTTAYDSSTTGTGCGTIDIKNNVITYCNYGIWGAGRYVLGATTIEDNVIEQNSICGIKIHGEQSFSDTALSPIRIVSNLLEGQTEAIDLRCNGASVEIAYNGFEYVSGQNIRIFQGSISSVSIIGNRMSSANPVMFYLTNAYVYARENLRSNANSRNMRLAIDRCHMIESDIPIDSISGICTANAKYLTRKAVSPLAKSNIAFDSYIDGNFRKLIADNNSYVSASLGFVTFEANKNYVVYFQLRIPKEVVGSKTYIVISAMSFEGEITPALYRDCDEIIVMIGKTFDTAPGLKSVSLLIKNNASGTPWYISDVAIIDTAPDQVPAPIIGETKNVNRPALSADNAGATYFDRTLGKQIVWNGTAWANMDGTALS